MDAGVVAVNLKFQECVYGFAGEVVAGSAGLWMLPGVEFQGFHGFGPFRFSALGCSLAVYKQYRSYFVTVQIGATINIHGLNLDPV